MTDAATALRDEITRRLDEALGPDRLEVVNESHMHAGHAGDDGSGVTHWRVSAVSARFAGLNRVGRHRLVNQALADLLKHPIHALAIHARAPGEG